MVNADLAQPLKANSGALVGESYREREQRPRPRSQSEVCGGSRDEYARLADFTDCKR